MAPHPRIVRAHRLLRRAPTTGSAGGSTAITEDFTVERVLRRDCEGTLAVKSQMQIGNLGLCRCAATGSRRRAQTGALCRIETAES